MVGTEKQIKFANDLISKLNKELQEIKDNKQVIIYLAIKHQMASNNFMSDEQLEKLRQILLPKIEIEFNQLINELIEKINSYNNMNAYKVINELKGKTIQSLYRNANYIYVTNNGIDIYVNRKSNKALFKETIENANKYFN